jgi:uncharacterized protein (DUF305 family)
MAAKLLSIMSQQAPVIKMTKEAMKQREMIQKFAQDIIDTQTKEINEFKSLLKNY